MRWSGDRAKNHGKKTWDGKAISIGVRYFPPWVKETLMKNVHTVAEMGKIGLETA